MWMIFLFDSILVLGSCFFVDKWGMYRFSSDFEYYLRTRFKGEARLRKGLETEEKK